jgi:hypothetical protein
MFKHDLGAATPEGIQVEENVQFGPPGPPLVVGLPAWIGTQNTVMYIGAGVIAAYLLYKYWYDIKAS